MERFNNQAMTPVAGRFAARFEDAVEAEVVNEPFASEHPNFIESNTQAISLGDLIDKCVIPTFSDNSMTISHQNFIYSVMMAAEKVFGQLTSAECRVSHAVNGRIASAQYKPVNELLDSEKTLFYQRLAFICHVKNLTREINGQTVHLTIGGCRSYNDDKLLNRQSPQKFKIFVAWSCKVCSNQMIQSDGTTGVIEALTESDIFQKAIELFRSFNPKKEENLKILENLGTTRISEEQFCSIVGRLRLYQALSNDRRRELNLPDFNIGDQAGNKIVQGYVDNPNFGKVNGEDITTWNLLQLSNEACKSAYIARFIDRNVACTDFAIGIQKALEGKKNAYNYEWFLN